VEENSLIDKLQNESFIDLLFYPQTQGESQQQTDLAATIAAMTVQIWIFFNPNPQPDSVVSPRP
jgi:hypothetical protein